MTPMDHTNFRSIWSDLQGVAFEQAYVEAGGIRTRYLHAGTRGQPALIFLHGTGGHAEAYVRNLAAHAEHFDVYAIDMLGHGYTDKPDHDYEVPRYVAHVAAFMDVMGLERASLSGESLGGDKINMEALARLRATSLVTVDDPTWERLKGRLEWLMHDKSLVHDDLIASRQRIYAAPEMKRAMEHILSMHTPEARQRFALTDQQFASIKAPTLVLWTSHDPTAPVEVGRHLASLITGAKFEVMEGCGHWPQFEDAATFNRIHVGFLLA